MSQRDPRMVLGIGYLVLLALVATFVWWVNHVEPAPPEPCAQPAVLYLVVTPTPTEIPIGPVLPSRTPVPPLILNEAPEQLPRKTVTRQPPATIPATPTPTVTPKPPEAPPAARPAVQKG